MARFVVESAIEIRGEWVVFARHTGGILFDLAPGAKLGDALIEPRYEQPRALDDAGELRRDLYVFRLAANNDAVTFSPGDEATLNFPGPTCVRCGTQWADPSLFVEDWESIVRETRKRGTDLLHSLREAGVPERTAKAAYVHSRGDGLSCHKCRSMLPVGSETECANCHSFNYRF